MGGILFNTRQCDPMKTASIHRMVMPGHICPSGLKALHLLRRKGYAVEDHLLRSRTETDAFKQARGVATTPRSPSMARRSAAMTRCAAIWAWPCPSPARPAIAR
jgi:glutaredoxin